MTLPDAAIAAEFALPDTAIATAARRLTWDASPEFVYNHAVRSYLFARELAALQAPADGAPDDELLFLTCVLHDLGATDYANTDQRFELDGADAAARFLEDYGVDAARIQSVWTAIALHTSIGLAHRFGPLAAIAQAGIGTDIAGTERRRLSMQFSDRVHAAWPRYDLGFAFAEVLAEQAERNPAKAPPLTFPAHVHQLLHPAHTAPTWFDLVAAAGWGDRPVDRTKATS